MSLGVEITVMVAVAVVIGLGFGVALGWALKRQSPKVADYEKLIMKLLRRPRTEQDSTENRQHRNLGRASDDGGE